MSDNIKNTDKVEKQSIDMEAIKAELREELKEELKAEMKAEISTTNEKKKKKLTETKAQIEHANERVQYMLPLIEGEPEEVNVTVNGETLQILRGEQVQIPRKFAEVLDNKEKQSRFFRKFQKEKKEQISVIEQYE